MLCYVMLCLYVHDGLYKRRINDDDDDDDDDDRQSLCAAYAL